MTDGSQAGTHAPKRGCWRCLEAFVEDVERWVDDVSQGEPDGWVLGDAAGAFRAWAAPLASVQHGGDDDD